MPAARTSGLGGDLWATIYVNVAAATLPAVLPVMVGVLADQLGFGSIRAGYVASANLAGIAAGSVICAASLRYHGGGTLIRAGAALMIGLNLVSMALASFPAFLLARGGAGIGEGMISAVCYAAMSRSSQSARAMALYVAGQGLVGAIGMGGIPGIVAHAGWPWLFAIVSAVALPAFVLAPRIGALHQRPGQTAPSGRGLRGAPLLALGCILVYFIGMSAVWSFTERLGHAKDIDLSHLSLALSASAVANMAGSLLVGMVASRVKVLTGLSVGATLGIGGLALLGASGSWIPFLAGVSVFFLSWGIYYPFQFKLLADADIHGRCAVLIPLVSGGGFTIGPALGGLLLEGGGPTLLCGFGAFCVALSSVAAVLLIWRREPSGVTPCTG